MPTIDAAFWNLQNLFDSTPSEIATDLEFTPENGWTEAAVEHKIANLAEVIDQLCGGRGPDLLGICEIENEPLAERLIDALARDDLVVAHAEAPDLRGIDCSLIYSGEVFELAGPPVGHLVHLRFATRDIFEIPLRVRSNGAELVVLVNHWPSRRRGSAQSEAFRITVASHLGRLVDRHLKLSRADLLGLADLPASRDLLERCWDRNVLLMGDFNDDPFDRSVQEVLQASNSVDRLEEGVGIARGRNLPGPAGYLGKQAYLFNYMWPTLGQGGAGTIFFSGDGIARTKQVFDQLMASRGLHFGLQGLQVEPDSVAVPAPRIMWTNSRLTDEAAQKSPHLVRPRPFDPATGRGYSDHFPVTARIEIL